MEDYEMKLMKANEQVLVTDAEEPSMQQQNVMGAQAISQKQLGQLHAQLRQLQESNNRSM